MRSHLLEMNLIGTLNARRRGRHAFTLVESMIALLILGVGSAMLYEGYLTSMYMVDKNIAMNEANTNLQYGYNRMLNTLESAGMFVDCANYSATTQNFTAVSTGTWGNAIRFMQLLPITAYVSADDSSGYSISNPPPPTTTTYLQSSDQYVYFSYNASLFNADCVTTDARYIRLIPRFPGRLRAGAALG
jgi:prepilin-type N-terminal cleavage/methylation domain-containing protein